jgi:hypothetical protein
MYIQICVHGQMTLKLAGISAVSGPIFLYSWFFFLSHFYDQHNPWTMAIPTTGLPFNDLGYGTLWFTTFEMCKTLHFSVWQAKRDVNRMKIEWRVSDLMPSSTFRFGRQFEVVLMDRSVRHSRGTPWTCTIDMDTDMHHRHGCTVDIIRLTHYAVITWKFIITCTTTPF